MTVIPFDERSSSRSSLAAWPDTPVGHPPGNDKKAQAVAELLEHGVLSHAFGQHGEYKVRTTMTTRQTWQYRCCVLRHGKAIKGAFFPIIVEHQPPTPHGSIRPVGTDDTRLSFAQEAVDVHSTRCAALREYLVLSALYDRPPTQSRGWYTLLAPLIGIAVVVAYGFWAHAFRVDSGQPPRSRAPVVGRSTPDRGAEGCFSPRFQSHNQPQHVNGQGDTLGPIDPVEMPKAVSVTDLLTLQAPPEKADHTFRASISRVSPLRHPGGRHAARNRMAPADLPCPRQHVPPVRHPKPAGWNPGAGRLGTSPKPGPRFPSRTGSAPDGSDLHQTAAAPAAGTIATRLDHAASDLCATDGPAVGSRCIPSCAFTRETLAGHHSALGDPPHPGGPIRYAL